MSRLELYKYDPLVRRDALRLLDLHPASSNRSEIDCDLVEFILLDPNSSHSDVHLLPKYEAVSWCWGVPVRSSTLRMHKGSRVYELPIVPNLESALRALRYPDRRRTLWIDAICIDQTNTAERNEQVPKMNEIYGQAESVCVWIGDAYENSDQALDFISSKVLSIWEFDKLCENLKEASNWAALINIMKRPWFSRRWCIQEIALARQATLYCGTRSMDWRDFADAVSLFVEVESATHRLSEVMRRDQAYNHVPEFFGNVPALGAALLVNATSNLFRHSEGGPRKPLLGLEHLVSTYSVFEATQPRDTIYALLAIAKDTTAQSAELEALQRHLPGINLLKFWAKQSIRSTPFPVDYDLPIVEVFKYFIEFAISKSDPTIGLNIICRPWAPRFSQLDDRAGLTTDVKEHSVFQQRSKLRSHNGPEDEVDMPSWIMDLGRAPYAMNEHPRAGIRMERVNADPLVGIPGSGELPYRAAGTRAVSLKSLKFVPRSVHYSMFVQGFECDTICDLEEPSRLGNIPGTWLRAVGWHNKNENPPEDFWRTLVADRGLSGRNPPNFYSRACKEAMTKMVAGNPLDTRMLINEGQCTIVAEFLRRVQAVIWNRCLVRTGGKHLGLVPADAKAGDAICVLYGCSVPVVLRKVDLTPEEVETGYEEEYQQALLAATLLVQRFWRGFMVRKRLRKSSKKDQLHQMDSPLTGETKAGDKKSGTPNPTIPKKPEKLRQSAEKPAVGPAGHQNNEGERVRSPASDKPNFETRQPNGPAEAKISAEHVHKVVETNREEAPSTAVPGKSNTSKPESGDASVTAVTVTDCPRTNGNSDFNHGKAPEVPTDDDIPTATTTGRDLEDGQKEGNNKSSSQSTTETRTETTSSSKSAISPSSSDEQTSANDKPSIVKRTHYWRLIGECYIHNMMNGEAIAWQNANGVKAEVFDLR